MVSLVRKLQHNLLQCTLSLRGLALDMSRGGMKGFLFFYFFLGRRMTLSHLVSGSPMMWFIGVWQVLHQHNELRDGELGLSTMEMSYWHPPSSLTMCRQWRALDLSWRFHCSHNSLMAPSAGSHPSRFLQTFVIEITLLICFPYSCIFGKYWTRFKIRPRLCTRSFVLVALPWMRTYSSVGIEMLRAEMKRSRDSSGDYTHLLCDSDGDDRAAGVPRGQRALSSLCHLATSAVPL